jgi:hypothetical protein
MTEVETHTNFADAHVVHGRIYGVYMKARISYSNADLCYL